MKKDELEKLITEIRRARDLAATAVAEIAEEFNGGSVRMSDLVQLPIGEWTEIFKGIRVRRIKTPGMPFAQFETELEALRVFRKNRHPDCFELCETVTGQVISIIPRGLPAADRYVFLPGEWHAIRAKEDTLLLVTFFPATSAALAAVIDANDIPVSDVAKNVPKVD